MRVVIHYIEWYNRKVGDKTITQTQMLKIIEWNIIDTEEREEEANG
jgi:hypothetical protein